VLAEGDPVPQLDRHDPALVDLALIGLPANEPVTGLGEADLEALLAELEAAPQKNGSGVALRGSGGLPLLAASMPGDRTERADGLIGILPPVVAGSAVTLNVTAAAEGGQTSPDAPSQARPRRLPSVTAVSGLTVAMGMLFGVILPDMSRLMSTRPATRFRLRFPLRRRRNV
jgi:hypothetical protein